MGVVEGYSADLYCDCDSCQSGEECRPKYADFAGENKAVLAELMDELPKCAVGLFLQQNFLDKITWICDTWSTTLTDVK